jgi:signal transduction histidine kinase
VLGEALTRSERQAQRLASVVTHILEIARITRNELVLAPEELDLAAVAREVVERIRGSGGSISIAGHGPLVGSWDRERIEQVVDNLLSNATKFGAGKPVEVAVGRQDGSAVLTVRDHGIGISPEDHARIFERFERAVSARNFSGFGLGLWIVRQNVEAHGGSIAVDSRAGEGSTFTVRLPLPA